MHANLGQVLFFLLFQVDLEVLVVQVVPLQVSRVHQAFQLLQVVRVVPGFQDPQDSHHVHLCLADLVLLGRALLEVPS